MYLGVHNLERTHARIMCSTCNCKRWTTRFTVACFFLAGGVEYSVILPTMFDYLRGFGGEEWLYGLCLSAFSISNFFMGPLFGFVFDRTHRTKLIVLFANLFEIGGNFMYFAATSKYMLLGSRFVVGVGAGAGAAIFGELARTTIKKERTTIFSVFMAMRQIGLVIGPAFNLFLQISDFKIGPFKVDKYTSPGAFMMLVWIIIELLVLFLFYEFPPVKEEECSEESNPSPSSVEPHSPCRTNTGNGDTDIDDKEYHVTPVQSDSSSGKDNSCELDQSKKNYNRTDCEPPDSNLEDEKSPLLLPSRPSTGLSINRTPNLSRRDPALPGNTLYGTFEDSVAKEDMEDSSSRTPNSVAARLSFWERVMKTQKHLWWLLLEFLREEIVVLLSVLFVTMFNQTTIEAMLVPMVKNLLDWTDEEISIFYSVAGVEIIVAFLVVTLLSRKIADRWQLLVGLVLELFGYGWDIGMIGNATKETPWILGRFIVGAVPILFGLPMFVATGASLYSKFLPMRIQGFGQGVRRSVFSIAAILGPLWAGGTVAFGDNYYVLLGVPCGLLVFITVLTFLSFPKLKETKKSNSTIQA